MDYAFVHKSEKRRRLENLIACIIVWARTHPEVLAEEIADIILTDINRENQKKKKKKGKVS
jgi:hypothetical protein